MRKSRKGGATWTAPSRPDLLNTNRSKIGQDVVLLRRDGKAESGNGKLLSKTLQLLTGRPGGKGPLPEPRLEEIRGTTAHRVL